MTTLLPEADWSLEHAKKTGVKLVRGGKLIYSPSPHSIPDDERDLMIDEFKAGAPVRDLAIKYGRTEFAVVSALTAAGVYAPASAEQKQIFVGASGTAKLFLPEIRLLCWLYERGITVKRIATFFKVAVPSVMYQLRKHNPQPPDELHPKWTRHLPGRDLTPKEVALIPQMYERIKDPGQIAFLLACDVSAVEGVLA